MTNVKANFILVFLFFSCIVIAQDVIIKNDKTEIKGKVYELTDTDIKYKKKELLDGPIYSVKKVEVFMIIYANGIREYIEVAADTNNTYANNYSNGNNSNGGSATSAVKPATTDNVSSTTPNKTQELGAVEENRVSYYLAGGSTMIDFNVFSKFKNSNFGIGYNFAMTIPPSSDYDIPPGYFFYPNATYKYPINDAFNVWGGAGPTWTYIPSYTIDLGYGYPDVEVDSVSEFNFTWQIGSDYFFGKKKSWGITGYTYEFEAYMFGLIFKA